MGQFSTLTRFHGEGYKAAVDLVDRAPAEEEMSEENVPYSSQSLGSLQLNFRGDGRFENVRLDGVRFVETSLAVF